MTRTPIYSRLLRLKHVRPGPVQRALLGEGAFAVALLLVLAGLVSAWALLVLPVAVAIVVKCHDVLAASLHRPDREADHLTASTRTGRTGSG